MRTGLQVEALRPFVIIWRIGRQEEVQLEGLLSPSLQRSQDTAFAQGSHPCLVGAL